MHKRPGYVGHEAHEINMLICRRSIQALKDNSLLNAGWCFPPYMGTASAHLRAFLHACPTSDIVFRPAAHAL